MTRFFKKVQKPCIWAIFEHFCPNGDFFQKNAGHNTTIHGTVTPRYVSEKTN